MRKFWFYNWCSEEEPHTEDSCPKCFVITCIESSREDYESLLKDGQNFLTPEELKSLRKEGRDKLLNLLRAIEVPVNEYGEFHPELLPKVRQTLLEAGWVEEYIPIGP